MAIKTEARKLVNTKSQFNYEEIDKYLNKKGYDRLDRSKGKKPTPRVWKTLLNKHPEWFGTTKTHVNKIDKDRIKADKILESNLKSGTSEEEVKVELAPDIYARAKSRLCKVVKVEDQITVLFPNGKVHVYDKSDIKTYKNQDKAEKKFENEINKRDIDLEELDLEPEEEKIQEKEKDDWGD